MLFFIGILYYFWYIISYYIVNFVEENMLKKAIFIIIFCFIIYSPLLAQEFEDFEESNETYGTQELKDYGLKLYESDEIDTKKLKKPYKKSPKKEYFEDYEEERYHPEKEKSAKRKATKIKRKKKEEEAEKRDYIIKDYKIDEDYPFEEDYKRDFIKDYGEEEAKFDHMPMDDVFYNEYLEPKKDKASYREYYEPKKDKVYRQKHYKPEEDRASYREYYEPEEDKTYREYYEPEKDKAYRQKHYKPEKPLKTCPAKMHPPKERLPKEVHKKLKKREKITASQEELLSIVTKPSWLFSIPTAFSLNENAYRIGFLHADMGMGNNMEIGISGFKWRFSEYSFCEFTPAIGVGFLGNCALIPFKPSTPGIYGVATLNIDTSNIHVGVKSLPYWGFIGADFNLTNKLRITAEVNDGILFGLRHNLSQYWNFGLALGYANYEGFWKFKLDDKKSGKAEFCVLLNIFYFNKFKE